MNVLKSSKGVVRGGVVIHMQIATNRRMDKILSITSLSSPKTSSNIEASPNFFYLFIDFKGSIQENSSKYKN